MALQDPARLSDQVDQSHPEFVARIHGTADPIDVLAQALSEPDAYPRLSEFVDACSKKTNVESRNVFGSFISGKH